MHHRSVLIAPPSLRPVLDALLDLSAAGTIDDFTWIEVSSDPATAPDREDPRALSVADGMVRASTFAAATNLRGLDVVRLVVLVPLGHPADDALTSSAENFYQGLDVVAGAQKKHIRVLIPWSADSLPAELGRAGWHDVMLSPESTAEPGFTAVPWWNHPEQIAGAAAVGVAVQSGIVRGVDAAPSDHKRQDISTDVAMVRTFVRRIDASDVENAIRSRVLRIGDRVPPPTRETGSFVGPYPSPENKVRDTAQLWGQRHAGSLRRQPPELPHSESTTVGMFSAFGLFVSFMVRALVSAPESWLRSVLHSARTSLAAGTTALVFGKSPAVSVIVGGVGSDGSSAGWRTIRDAARQVSLEPPQDSELRGQPVRRDFAALWADLLQGGRALLDGSLCTNLGIETATGHVPQRSLVAPALDGDGSYVVTEPLGNLPGDTVLHAWDHLEIDRVERELEQVTTAENSHAQLARKHLSAITAWRERTSHSFISRVGAQISGWFEGARGDITRSVRQLEQMLEAEPDDAVGRTQRKLAGVLRTFLLLLIAVLILLGVLAVQGALSTLSMGIGMGVAAGGWLIASFITFLRSQREVFRLLHLRDERETRLPVLRERLRMAIEDLEALGEAYAQFDRWAMLLTLFLDRPFGAETDEQTATTPERNLPVAMQAPLVHADPERTDDVAAHLRSSLFTVGWLGPAFERFEAHISHALSSEQRVRVRQANARPLVQLLSIHGDPGSELANWAESTRRVGVRSDHGDLVWSRCLERLSGPGLLDLHTRGGAHAGDGAGTIKDLRAELSSPRAVSVVDEVLQLDARTHENRMVDPAYTWLRDEPDGLGSTIVLAQSTRPIAQESFVFPYGRPARSFDDHPESDVGLQPLSDDIVF